MSEESVKLFRQDVTNWEQNRLMSLYPTVDRKDLEQNGIIIYGADAWGKGFALQLLEHGIKPRYMIDKNPLLHGITYCGIEIMPIEYLDNCICFVLLASTNVFAMSEECDRRGAHKWMLPYALRNIFDILGEFGIGMCKELGSDDVVNTFGLFTDEKSREIYRRYVKWHLLFDNDFSDLYDDVVYFPNDLRKRINYNNFVDCGAFDGDTLQTWLQEYKPHYTSSEYWAFEPDPHLFVKLNQYVGTLDFHLQKIIHLSNAGVGSANESFRLTSIQSWGGQLHKSDSRDDSNAGLARVVKLDDALSDTRVTVIKADIEGFEAQMLMGAKRLIEKNRPTLILSLYHKFSDLYKIPLWINSLNLEYDLFLRHHSPRFTDTALYAIPRV